MVCRSGERGRGRAGCSSPTLLLPPPLLSGRLRRGRRVRRVRAGAVEGRLAGASAIRTSSCWRLSSSSEARRSRSCARSASAMSERCGRSEQVEGAGGRIARSHLMLGVDCMVGPAVAGRAHSGSPAPLRCDEAERGRGAFIVRLRRCRLLVVVGRFFIATLRRRCRMRWPAAEDGTSHW